MLGLSSMHVRMFIPGFNHKIRNLKILFFCIKSSDNEPKNHCCFPNFQITIRFISTKRGVGRTIKHYKELQLGATKKINGQIATKMAIVDEYDNTSCFQENTVKYLPRGRPSGRDRRRSLRSLSGRFPERQIFYCIFLII